MAHLISLLDQHIRHNVPKWTANRNLLFHTNVGVALKFLLQYISEKFASIVTQHQGQSVFECLMALTYIPQPEIFKVFFSCHLIPELASNTRRFLAKYDDYVLVDTDTSSKIKRNARLMIARILEAQNNQ
jgi:hypothetical protein